MKKRFNKVNIEISNICNLQCSFCPEVLRARKLMDTELFEHLIRQLVPLTEQVCFHLMGDPLVHPKLSKFIQICESYAMPVFFVSNGVLLKDSTNELLLSPVIRQVNFSLHSFFDNYPGRNPDVYLKRIFDFTNLAFARRPDLYVNYRLWNLNDPRGSLTDNNLMLEKIKDHFNVPVPAEINVRRNKSVHLVNRLYLHYDTEFIWPSLELENLGQQGTCYGLSSHFGILADGTVVPCCLDKEGLIPLGNAVDTPLTEILAAPIAQTVLRGFQQRKLVNPLCQRCNYIERFG